MKNTIWVLVFCLLLLGGGKVSARLEPLPDPGINGEGWESGLTSRVSVASDGTERSGESYGSVISGDGRLIAFVSVAALVEQDTNGYYDIYVHDRQTRETNRVSVASDDSQADDDANFVAISADGRYVTFVSTASNLVAGDTNGVEDVFVHDRQTGSTSRVSVASDGTQANAVSTFPELSGDGRYIVFRSDASNLVAGDSNDASDIFFRDQQTNTTSRISIASDGSQGNGESWNTTISDDGRYVAFSSYATNLVSGDTNGVIDVFLRDIQTGTTSRISVASDGTQANGDSWAADLSSDGRYIAFSSYASNLVEGATNNFWNIFIHDDQTGETTWIETPFYTFGGPKISGDGRYILLSGPPPLFSAFIVDRETGEVSPVAIGSNGEPPNWDSYVGDISADGRYATFSSRGSSLIPGDNNQSSDIFLRDRDGEPLTFTVNSTADLVDASLGDGICAASNGLCTLRAAIQEANFLSSLDTIHLPAGTYSLTLAGTGEDTAATGDWDIRDHLTITGSGSGNTIVDGNGTDRVFHLPLNAAVTMTHLTIQNGVVSGFGGGIYQVDGHLSLNDAVIRNNQAGSGGGIYTAEGGDSYTETPLQNVLITNNQATQGGGIFNRSSMILVDSTIDSNSTNGGHGGGVYNENRLHMENSTISHNETSGGHGGGIYTGGEFSYADIRSSTISGNRAEGGSGGGVYSELSTHPFNALFASTIYNNQATEAGGGLWTDNEYLDIWNAIVAHNLGGDCFGLSSGYWSLDSDNTCNLDPSDGNLPGTNPMLGPLQDNGGPTLTHAILPGSPVIDQGDWWCGDTDQRGISRPTDGIEQCDIGAYEMVNWRVTKTNDTNDGFCDDDCSLREAIIASNEAPGSDAVIVPAGAYTLSIPGTAENESVTGDLDMTDDLHLIGDGIGVAIIDGGGLDRVIDIPGETADTTVQISGLTIQNGTAGIHAIRSHLTLKNTAVTYNLGYGIEAGSSAFSTTLTLQNSWLTENNNTGLWATHTEVLLKQSMISQNSAADVGGVHVLSGTLTIQSSTISSNSGEIGGVSTNAPFTITRSAIISNTGSYGPGGLWLDNPGAIVNSTISGNSGTEGAGIWAGQALTIHSSTIVQNTAVGIGTDPLETGNGGGIFATEPVTLQNSIVFSNTSSASSPDCAGTVASQGYNMVGIAAGCAITTTVGDLFGVDPLLEPLQNFAGFIWYHALPQESPAVDAGNPAGCTNAANTLLTHDQRGFPRHIDGNEDTVPVCDIGSVEFFIGFTLYLPVISR